MCARTRMCVPACAYVYVSMFAPTKWDHLVCGAKEPALAQRSLKTMAKTVVKVMHVVMQVVMACGDEKHTHMMIHT